MSAGGFASVILFRRWFALERRNEDEGYAPSERLLRRRAGSASWACFSALFGLACTGEVQTVPNGSAGRPVYPEAGGQSVEPGGGTSSTAPSGSGGAGSRAGGGTSGGATPSSSGGAAGASTPECTPGAISAALAKLRRLTPEEYANTVRDLLGDEAKPRRRPIRSHFGSEHARWRELKSLRRARVLV
jgi:hypothetical protein